MIWMGFKLAIGACLGLAALWILGWVLMIFIMLVENSRSKSRTK